MFGTKLIQKQTHHGGQWYGKDTTTNSPEHYPYDNAQQTGDWVKLQVVVVIKAERFYQVPHDTVHNAREQKAQYGLVRAQGRIQQ
mgnify:CR=1 FL=1